MEFEEIIKRVEWLDEQQRKGKTDLNDLDGKVVTVETSINALTQQLKTLNQQMKDVTLAAARMGQFDEIMAKHRSELGKMVETTEKNAVRREQESAKLRQAELEDIRKTLFELGKAVSAEATARKDRVHDEQRRTLVIQDIQTAVEAVNRQNKDLLQGQKTLEGNHRQLTKPLADLQVEMASIRKRADDALEHTTLHTDSIRNIENRINELIETDSSRHARHAALLQQQALAQVERDHAWKEWQAEYESFKQKAAGAESMMASFENSIRAAQRAEEAYDGLSQRLERRITEVGEIQRLAEERLRQEWVAFKADEQKRWAGHSMSQDESIRDLRKIVEKIDQRLTTVEDTGQTIQDQLHQTTDTTEQQLQELMNLAQEWLSAYERIMGHAMTKSKKPTR